MTFLKLLKDPLEACLIEILKGEDTGCPTNERGIYVKLLNLAPTIMGKHDRGPCMEPQLSKDDKENTSEVELKPLHHRLRYVFIDPDKTFPVIVSTKLNDSQLGKLLCVL